MGFALPHSCERKKVNDTSYKFLSFCSLCSHGEEVCVHRLKSECPDAHGYQSNDIGLILFFSYLFSCFLLIKQEVKSILRLQLEISKGLNVWGQLHSLPPAPDLPATAYPQPECILSQRMGNLATGSLRVLKNLSEKIRGFCFSTKLFVLGLGLLWPL